MTIDLTHFLFSLAAAMADAAGIALGEDLFVHKGNEARGNNPQAVLRVYGSEVPDPLFPVPSINVQVGASGTDDTATLALLQRLYESLQQPEEGEPFPRARRQWILDGKKPSDAGGIAPDPDTAWCVVLIRFLGRPGVIGRDDRGGTGRVQAVFNMTLKFKPV